MVNLNRFELNPFDDDKNISMANFHQFSNDHLNRLEANNPAGVFTTILDATRAIFGQFNAVYGSKTVEEALRKGATVGLGFNVNTILNDARTLEKQVAFLFGKGTPKYISFFPRGLTELNEAGKGEWPIILIRLKTATAANAAEVGAPVVTLWNNHESAYSQANTDQTGRKGTVDQLRSQLLVDRKALARQMFINLHTIVIYYVDTPDSLPIYFDQSIVDRRQSSDSDGKGRLLFAVSNTNGTMLPNVQLSIQDENSQNVLLGQKTDANGEFRSPPLPVGRYMVTFQLMGYLTRTAPFDVFDDQDVDNQVQLEELV